MEQITLMIQAMSFTLIKNVILFVNDAYCIVACYQLLCCVLRKNLSVSFQPQSSRHFQSVTKIWYYKMTLVWRWKKMYSLTGWRTDHMMSYGELLTKIQVGVSVIYENGFEEVTVSMMLSLTFFSALRRHLIEKHSLIKNIHKFHLIIFLYVCLKFFFILLPECSVLDSSCSSQTDTQCRLRLMTVLEQAPRDLVLMEFLRQNRWKS